MGEVFLSEAGAEEVKGFFLADEDEGGLFGVLEEVDEEVSLLVGEDGVGLLRRDGHVSRDFVAGICGVGDVWKSFQL